MNQPRQREDIATSDKVTEALALKRAFGHSAAKAFLRQHQVQPVVTEQVLAGTYDRRQDPDRRLAPRLVLA